MADSTNEPPWTPMAVAERMQQASEEFTESQLRLIEQALSAGNGAKNGSVPKFAAQSMETAVFKTRVQSGGRISIPDAEREALDIEEGDLVQTFVVPIRRERGEDDE